MINIDIKKTSAYKALQLKEALSSQLVFMGRSVAIYLSLVLAIIIVVYELKFIPPGFIPIGLAIESFIEGILDKLLGLFFFFVSIGITLSLWLLFLDYLKNKPTSQKLSSSIIEGLEKGNYNLAEWLDFEIIQILGKAGTIRSEKLDWPISLFLLSQLIKESLTKQVLARLGLSAGELEGEINILKNFKDFKKEKSVDLEAILLGSVKIAALKNKERAGIADLLTILAKNDPVFAKFLFRFELDENDVANVAQWLESTAKRREQEKKFWSYEYLMRVPGIGKQWHAGYTVNLDKFSHDITEKIEKTEGFLLQLIGHEQEIEMLERILARSGENNAFVIGEPGSGRQTVIYGLAKLIYQGRVLPQLEHKRMLELDLNALLAGAADISEMQARIITIFNEAVKSRNVILVIDEFDNFIGKAFAPGKIDISGILSQYLSSKYFQVIGISDYAGFHKYLEPNSVIMKSFERVEIEEPSGNEAIMILEDVAPRLEAQSGVIVTYQALRDIVRKSEIYIQEIAMPEKAINLLDEVVVYVAEQKKKKAVLPEDVDAVLTQRTGIPIGKMAEEEKEKLLNLEEILHKRLIDQEEAINTISGTMRRARAGIAATKKPVGSFLFLGPTGVGKTETAKTLAETYFGHEEKMIRFDMSEYQDIASINRLIGSAELGEPGQLANAIRQEPFSLVLFDEIDKAHPDILNLFLQVLDEGFLTDAFGKKVNFRNTIIICTSNAGANLIREYVETGIDPATIKDKIIDHIQAQGIFRPEFVNRFDAVVVYHPLSKENLDKIAELLLEDLNKRLEEKDIKLEITQELKKRVVELGYEPEFGARPMRRVIQDKIENLIAKNLLSGKIKRGDTVTINPLDL